MEYDNLTSSVNEDDYDDLDDDFDFDEDEIFKLVSVIILSILGVAGNAIIIFAYVKKKRCTSTDVLIVAQAITDFIATALAPSLILKTAFSSLVNNGVCIVSEIAENGTAFTSLFIMMAISADRYIAICRPFRRRLSNHHAIIITFSCVVASIAIMSPRAIFIKSIKTDSHLEVNCEIHHDRKMRLFVAALFPVTFVGALLVTSILYTKIYIFLRRQAKVHVSLVNANTEAVDQGKAVDKTQRELNNRVCTVNANPHQVATCSFFPGTCDDDLLSGKKATADQPHIELLTLTQMKVIPSGLLSDVAEANVHGEEQTAPAAVNIGTAGTAVTTAAINTTHSNNTSCDTSPKSSRDDSNACQAPSRKSNLAESNAYWSKNSDGEVSSFTITNAVTTQFAAREEDPSGRGQQVTNILTGTAGAEKPNRKRENDMGRTTTKILLFLTLYFFLTWIPQIFLTLFFQGNVYLLTSNSLALVIGGFSVLRSTNHVVNIFVYYYANHPFRKAVNKMFKQPCKLKAKIW